MARDRLDPLFHENAAVGDIGGHGACIRIGHQAARAQYLAKAPHRSHHVRCSDDGVEIRPAFALNLGDHVFAAYVIGSSFGSFALLVTRGDHQDLLRFPQAVRQHHGTADHLVGVLGIDPQAHVQFHRLVEFCELDLLDQRNGFVQAVGAGLDLFRRSFKLLTLLRHAPSLVQTAETLVKDPCLPLRR